MSKLVPDSEVLGILQGYNPWWSGRSIHVPEFRRLAYDACRRYLDDPTVRRAVLLSGPRRVGKTTILYQIASGLVEEGLDPRSVVYASLDHPILKMAALPDILAIYHANVYTSGQPAVLLLDEIQYSKDWDLQLKQLIDHKPEYRVVATGSASILHRKHLSESGVGRWVRVPIPTLSFFEFVRIRQGELEGIPKDLRPQDLFAQSDADRASLAAAFRPWLPLFRHYLLVGGFPETARQNDTGMSQRLLREDVVERVLKKDMALLFGVRDVGNLERLFIYLCLHSGGQFSANTCAKALGVTGSTVANYLEVLEESNLIFRVPPTRIGGKKVLKARHKIYLVDAALRNAVLLRGEEIFSNASEMGMIVETAVLRHLYAYYYRDSPRICYWRDPKGGKEVDIIVQSPWYTIPVEVKYADQAPVTPEAGILTYCREESVRTGYWITKNDRDFDLFSAADGTKILRVPAHIFTYLIGQAERLLWTSHGQAP